MKIRLATLEDAPSISALASALSREFIAHEFTEDAARILLESMDPPSIRRYIASGYRYHVAEEEGALIGAIAIKGNDHIYHLFVSKGFHGRGIARALWNTAKAESLAEGNPGRFTVNASLGAVGLYERFGFVKQSGAVNTSGVLSVPMRLEGRGARRT
jgi:GNAT superfamily N-acetyltransferase